LDFVHTLEANDRERVLCEQLKIAYQHPKDREFHLKATFGSGESKYLSALINIAIAQTTRESREIQILRLFPIPFFIKHYITLFLYS
jgi:hypothetical protein